MTESTQSTTIACCPRRAARSANKRAAMPSFTSWVNLSGANLEHPNTQTRTVRRTFSEIPYS